MKKLNFKKVGLVIKNNLIINRSVPVILLIVSLVISALIGAMPVSSIETRYATRKDVFVESYESYKESMTYLFEQMTGFDGIYSVVFITLALIVSILIAMAVNSFMRDKSGNDFYHSLSVNRSEIFVANYITTLISSAVIIISSQLVSLAFMNFIAEYDPMSFGELVLAQLPVIGSIVLFTAVFSAIAMIATVGAGTVFASIVNYAFINFFIPFTILCLAVAGNVLFNSNLFDLLEHNPSSCVYTSPYLRYIFSAMGFYKMGALDYVITALCALVLAALGIFIYSVKKNENGSKPLPFKLSIRPLQYILTFDAILLGTSFFDALTDDFAWCIVGMLVTLFFAFIIFNAFADKSFAHVFRGSKHMLFILVITLVFGAVFSADIFGLYKKPVPDFEKMESAYINFNFEDSDHQEWAYYDFESDESKIEKYNYIRLDKEAAALIVELYRLTSSEGNAYLSNEKGDDYISISIGVTCKNDMAVYHSYTGIHESSEKWDKIIALINKLEKKYPQVEKDVYYFEETAVYE